MSPLLVKGIIGAIGLGGAVVGGYYAVEALTDERVPPRNTVWKELKSQGYTVFFFNEEKWQEKFTKFEATNKSDVDFGDMLKIQEGNKNNQGGKALKEWCGKILDLEKEKINKDKTIENAKDYCVEKPSAKPSEETTKVQE